MLLLMMAAAQAASVPPPVVVTPRAIPGPPPPPLIRTIPEPQRLRERPSRELFERAVQPSSRLPLPLLFNAADYPATALRAAKEGTTAVAVTINPEGRVDGCFVESSAGDASLDSATCRILGSRARFEPARNAQGQPVPSAMTVRIRWQLPPNSRIPITAWQMRSTATLAANGQLLSCSEEMEGITRPPIPGCRGFANNMPVGQLGTGSGPARIQFDVRLVPGAVSVSQLPKADGEVLLRTAAHLRIGTDGQVLSCDIIEHGGLLMFANRRPVDCRTVFRGPYARPDMPTEVTTLVSFTRLK